MAEKRVYTFVSGKAVKGLQRIARNRDVYVSTSPSDRGYTVITASPKRLHEPREKQEKIHA